jgi:hypothetical protein
MEAAFQLAETRGWRSVEFRDATAWDPPSEAPSAIFYGHSIDLSEGDTTAVERCDPAVRRSIRKAERSGLRMVEASDERAIREYYRLHCQTRRRQGSPPQPFSFFARLHNRLLAAGLGCVLLAFKDQTAVAGAVFLFWGRNAMYKFGASDEAHQALRPNNLVFREALRVCVRRGCRQLDLGRTSVFNAGLRRFKLGWGSTEREIRYYRRRVPDRSVVPTPDHAAGWHSAVFRRMPISVARLMAKFAYRFAA